MKRAIVAGLIRLYPSRWRAEFGDEFAALLLDHPFGAGTILNVGANAVWQQLRMGEPWVLVGVPLLVWYAVGWVLLILFRRPVSGPPIGGFPGALVLSFLVGLWTSRRCRTGGGRAVVKMALLPTAPLLVIGILTALGVVHAIQTPYGTWYRFAGPGPDETEASRVLWGIVWRNANGLAGAALIGWLGGLSGRLSRRWA